MQYEKDLEMQSVVIYHKYKLLGRLQTYNKQIFTATSKYL